MLHCNDYCNEASQLNDEKPMCAVFSQLFHQPELPIEVGLLLPQVST